MKKRVLRFVTISCVVTLLLIGLNAFAQEETESVTKLDTVVVTASKKGSTLLNTPASISVITAKDIEKSGQKDIAAIISSIPGVIDDSSGSGTYFSFRGMRSTMSGGPAIYIDGRPLNFGKYGYSKIDDIPVEIVERIEVIKSPPASMYGNNSSRGVINIITKTGKYTQKPLNFTAKTEIGSWDTYKNFLGFSGNKNQWNYNLNANREESDGYRRHRDTELTAIDGQLGYEFDSGLKLDTYMGWNDSFKRYGTALRYWALKEDRRQNDPLNKDVNQRNTVSKKDKKIPAYRYKQNESEQELLTGGLALKYGDEDWSFNSSLHLSHLDDGYSSLKHYNNPGSGTTQRGSCYEENRDEDKVDFKISGGRTFSDGDSVTDTVTLGYDYSWCNWSQRRTYPCETVGSDTGIRKANIDAIRGVHGIFVNNELSYGKWGLLSGMRYDVASYNMENEIRAVEKTHEELGWDIAPSYSLTPNSNLYCSTGQSFWYPTIGYFSSAMSYDSPDNQPEDLEPEKYTNYEVGFKHRMAKWFNYSASLYRTDIDNKYMPFYDSSGDYKGYKPIGDSTHQGVELGADGRPLEWVGYRLGFTLIDAEWRKADSKAYTHGNTPADDTYKVENISGKKLYRVPEYEYSVGLDFYPIENWQFSVDTHGFGEQYIDKLNMYKNKAVTLVDTKLTYTVKNWQIYLACSNLFDTKHESIFNSSGDRNPDGTSNHTYYPKNGRYFGLGAIVKF